VQLVHNGGFADAGIAGYQHEFWCALGHDAIEGGEQGVDLALPPVTASQGSATGPTRRARRAGTDRCDQRLPFRQAPSQIGYQTGGGLVALLGVFGEELQGDRRQRLGDRGALAGRRRLTRDVAVDPLQGIGGRKGRAPVSIW